MKIIFCFLFSIETSGSKNGVILLHIFGVKFISDQQYINLSSFSSPQVQAKTGAINILKPLKQVDLSALPKSFLQPSSCRFKCT